MSNTYLNFLSVVYNELEEQCDHMDEQLAEYDDGESRSVRDSRELISAEMENLIEHLEKVKEDLQNLPYKKLLEKYDIEEDD